jgi:hypothetical protein
MIKKKFMSTLGMKDLTGKKYDWKPLFRFCMRHGLTVEPMYNESYGYVNAFPVIAWSVVYGIDVNEEMKKLPPFEEEEDYDYDE